MMLTFKVFELPYTDDEDDDENIEMSLEECETVEHTFYTIDNIKPLDNGKYCIVASGGYLYTVNERHSIVKEKIAEQKRLLFNQN